MIKTKIITKLKEKDLDDKVKTTMIRRGNKRIVLMEKHLTNKLKSSRIYNKDSCLNYINIYLKNS